MTTVDQEYEFHQVLVVGAGFSGICMSIFLSEKGFDDHIIVEKSDQVGGTWYHNKYPGAECDVESHLYCYSFAPRHDWSRVFSGSDEIQKYLEGVTNKYNVYPRIQFHTIVTQAHFDGEYWTVTTVNSQSPEVRKAYRSQFVVLSASPLHFANFPNIPGIKSFGGKVLHTSKWDSSYDFTGKRIAVIGSGASAIQVIPELAEVKDSKVVVFQRTPNWIIPKFNRNYLTLEKYVFRFVPLVQRLYRRYLYNYHESFWATFHKDSLANRIATAYSKLYFNRVIKDTTLLKKVIPTYPIGCKRILLSDNYLQSLVKPNVTVVTDPIQEITKNSVVTEDGTCYEDLDALVLATGFDLAGIMTSVKIPEDQMVKDPKQYLGIYSQSAKNLFVMVGSNSGSSHTSIILYIEAQCRHIVNMLSYMKEHNKKTVRVKDDLHSKYNEKLQEKSKKLVFHECSTWYVKDGLNFTVYPYNIHHFEQTVAKASFEDDFIYT